ncbi:unnamed protein product [Pseudo-nitzschia multistriata]|uniref:SP-RING-type domain-containing protein n=1 Tax=Pseudo-nitzschia multistriata TaxID=183589 RepID=A0A448YXY8_9STRA|nr:unnamed protein product [Pseudo-nitzschia multistriata]
MSSNTDPPKAHPETETTEGRTARHSTDCSTHPIQSNPSPVLPPHTTQHNATPQHTMPYYPQSQERSSIGVLASLADRQAKKLKANLEEAESMSSGIALRIARGQRFEELLGAETTEALREELLKSAKENIAVERNIRAYSDATRVVCGRATEAMNQSASGTDTGGESNSNPKPHRFQQETAAEYRRASEAIAAGSGPIAGEPAYAKLCRLLGEEESGDEELAVVGDHGIGLSDIRCPLTLAPMEVPFRSSVCGHVFEKAAILQLLKKSRKCPKPGCNNVSMSASEFAEDPDTARKVRRYKKREEATQRVRARAAIDMDDDDDEELQL